MATWVEDMPKKLGGVLVPEKATLKPWSIDYGRKLGALKGKDISYIYTDRIEKRILQ